MSRKTESLLNSIGILLAIWVLFSSQGGETMPAWLELASSWYFWVLTALIVILCIRLVVSIRDKSPSPEMKAIQELTATQNSLIERIDKLLGIIEKEHKSDESKRQ